MDTTNVHVYALVKARTTAAKSAMAQDEAKKMIITFFSCRGYMKGRKIRQNLSHESSPTVNKRAKTPKVLMKADTGIPRKQILASPENKQPASSHCSHDCCTFKKQRYT